MRIYTVFCSLCVIACLSACTGGKGGGKVEGDGSLPAIREVSVLPLARQTFSHVLSSSGKVAACAYADLYFRTAEMIAHVWVKNGDRVHKGQKIAELDLFQLKNALVQSSNSLKQAELEMQDVLIAQGYSPDRMEEIPAEIIQLAKVKSGYEQSMAQYEVAQYNLENGTLITPINGVIANLYGKEHNMAQASQTFCRVIDTGTMEVDFKILESELGMIGIGDEVEVVPYSVEIGKLQARISEINPQVDDKGTVRIKARVKGNSWLLDGMNVQVFVKQELKNQLVIPKSAVVLRNGKQVVFTLEGGKATCYDVHIALENAEEVVVASGLEEGMQVITAGNENLLQGTPVKIRK